MNFSQYSVIWQTQIRICTLKTYADINSHCFLYNRTNRTRVTEWKDSINHSHELNANGGLGLVFKIGKNAIIGELWQIYFIPLFIYLSSHQRLWPFCGQRPLSFICFCYSTWHMGYSQQTKEQFLLPMNPTHRDCQATWHIPIHKLMFKYYSMTSAKGAHTETLIFWKSVSSILLWIF